MTTLTTTPTARSRTRVLRGFSTTYVRLDLRRVMRNRRAMIFTLAVPTLMYLIFGATADYGSDKIGSANTAAYVMIHMAIYGAILATTTTAASVALEQQAGWTRTLRMTPMTPAAYVVSKVLVALTVAALPLILLSAVGVATGASAPVGDWVAAVLLGWLGSALFAAFGLAVGSALRSDAATQVLGGVLTLLAFAGNVFVPLKGAMLTFSMFTPMFGVSQLANYPITGGVTAYGDHISLLVCFANIAVWAAIFGYAAIHYYRKSTARQ
ncbi:MAG: ABC transporter [Gordonia sp.]|uniref:ABC transporter permease n=1 Tax=Gordonia rubripertincta TaxID=36822 RepID=A0ABT4MR48_GORRU|nr:ABC transporter permease [Gordonia rubripertincta]MBA4021429.1 ABC transporter [Gordonia sp. (in: high G+C Gram-positive bacteria)]MCZ4549469.1 ABC transporter permease [Gordonia rubripertincta]